MLATVALAALGAGPALGGEVTGAADSLRTGWYPDEPSLSRPFVEEHFNKAFNEKLQGQIYAQPLVANGTLLVATEENFVYALDPITGAKRWEDKSSGSGTTLGTAVEAGEGKTVDCTDLTPRVGITGTPVIDTERDVAYFVSNRYLSGGSGATSWFMHAVKLDNGQEAPNFPVEITGHADNVAGTEFTSNKQLQRPALLMMNGIVYAGFGSHCDNEPYEGWIVGVSATLGKEAHVVKWATTAAHGGSVWQSGGGLVSDGPGRIFFSTGNNGGGAGQGDPTPGDTPQEGQLAESVVRVNVQPNGSLKSEDFFSPFNNQELDSGDVDLGASAPVALPSLYFGTTNVGDPLVQEGKFGTVYLLNRESLGGMGEGKDNVVQEISQEGGVWGAAAVWPGDGRYVYIPSVSQGASSEESHKRLRFFKYSEENGNPHLAIAGKTPESEPLWFGSGSPIVTSNGTTDGSGLVWITWCPTSGCGNAELRAYSAAAASGSEPKPIWKGSIEAAAKFTRPYASNGHVYVGNREGHIIAFSGPVLTPSTTSLKLGSTLTGSSLQGQVTFTDAGTPLKVKGVKAPTAPFTVTGLPAKNEEIKPGQVVTANVAFKPSTAGAFEGTLELETEAGPVAVTISASAEEPRTALTASTASLELGATIPGARLSGEVAFTNTGNTTLGVSSAQSPTEPFEASGLPAAGSQIAPGAVIKVNVTFSPSVAGAFRSSLGLLTQAGATDIALSAAAEAPAEQPGSSSTVGFIAPGGPGLLGIEPAPGITNLRIRAFASRLSSHRRKLVVSYSLSAPGRIEALVYRRVTSHHCAAGVSHCGRWAATHIKLRVAARTGNNLLTVPLGTAPAATYRLALTPLAASGARGVTQYLRFKTLH